MEETFALPHINKLQSYIPGMPIETLARKKDLTHIIKLASNENPLRGACRPAVSTSSSTAHGDHGYASRPALVLERLKNCAQG